MKKIISALLILISVFLLASCSSKTENLVYDNKAQIKTCDDLAAKISEINKIEKTKVVAKAKGKKIYQKDLVIEQYLQNYKENYYKNLVEEYKNNKSLDKDLKDSILEYYSINSFTASSAKQIINDKLLNYMIEKDCKRKNITLTDEEIEKYKNSIELDSVDNLKNSTVSEIVKNDNIILRENIQKAFDYSNEDYINLKVENYKATTLKSKLNSYISEKYKNDNNKNFAKYLNKFISSITYYEKNYN